MAAITALFVEVTLLASTAIVVGTPRPEDILRITCDPVIPIYGGTVNLTCEYRVWPAMEGDTDDYFLTWYFNSSEIEEGDSHSSSDSHRSKFTVTEMTIRRSNLTIRNISKSDAGRYTCETKNQLYRTWFEIQPKKPEMKMRFDRNSSSPVKLGDSTTLWCFVEGNPNTRINWGFLQPVMGGTEKIPSTKYYEIYNVYAHSSSNLTYASLKLILQRVVIEQTGAYYCEVDRLNENQPRLYKTLRLDVQGISVHCEAEDSDSEDDVAEVIVGEDKIFTCEIRSNPAIRLNKDIVWKREGQPINTKDRKYDLDFKGLGQPMLTVTLKIKNAEPRDAAIYTIEVGSGSLKKAAKMTLSVEHETTTPVFSRRTTSAKTYTKNTVDGDKVDASTLAAVAGTMGAVIVILTVVVVLLVLVIMKKHNCLTCNTKDNLTYEIPNRANQSSEDRNYATINQGMGEYENPRI